MPKKEDLLDKISRKPSPNNFTTRELDTLLGKCNCDKFSGGRGSSIAYCHRETKQTLQFDGPHPGNELYRYQIKMVLKFLKDIGEID
ncbi:type II toxin-antitoxin system HicA family toxin [Aminipila butyrica]|uniref:Type II toxin-antitoxin system HicA family toxin n=1 Tax=Aminipila butyrica TaxID=433296 RepID=A0A858BYH7_9FIRM|nr:type II toxin-antitoxin system HicA family toxin [Aminipila butyrica]QIB69764.1 type II toxin-antitoxin system HicA family toxin [Aminipila butyrica]